MKIKIAIVCFLYYNLLFTSILMAQHGVPFIKNIPATEYSSLSTETQNWCFEQSNEGIIFIGNTEGIFEFDGNTWRLMPASNGSVIRSMCKDANGTVFAGASGDIGYIAPDSLGLNRFVSLLYLIPDSLKNFNNVRTTICINKLVYFITANEIFEYNGKSIEVIKPDFSPIRSFKTRKAIYIQQSVPGVYKLLGKQISLMPETENITPAQVLELSDGSLLIFDRNNGFYKYTSENKLVKIETDEDLLRKLNLDAFYTATLIGNDKIAWATLLNGLYITDLQLNVIQRINKKTGLQSNTVYGVFADRDDNLWLGLAFGISLLEINPQITKFNLSHGIESQVLSMTEYAGSYYFGTTDGLYLLDETGSIPNFIHFGSTGEVWDFLQQDDQLYAFSNQGIFAVYPHQIGKLITIGRGIYCLLKSEKYTGYIYVGLMNGLEIIKLKNDKLDNIQVTERIIISEIKEDIRSILEDEHGNIWLSTNFDGLIKITFENATLTTYKIERFGTADGLPRTDNNVVYKWKNKYLVTTRSGIFAIKQTAEGKVYFVRDSVFGAEAASEKHYFSKIITYGNRVFLQSNREFGEVIFGKKTTWKTEPYMRIPTSIVYKYFIDSKGGIWAGSSDALYRSDANIDSIKHKPLKVLVRKVILGSDSIIFSGYIPKNFEPLYSKERDNLKLKQKIEYENNSISFTYVSNSYLYSDMLTYATKLEGLDRQWSDWSKQTERSYTNLPEGKYVFKVKAKIGNNEEVNESSFEFVILPPIYRAWWAILFYFVFAAAFFIISIELYTRSLRNANLKLENTIENRTKQISQQNFEIKEQAQLLEISNKELEKLSIVADKTNNAVIITDNKANIEWLNNGFKEMFDYDLVEFTAKFGNCLINDTNPEYVNKTLLTAIQNKSNESYEMKLQSKKGKELWIHANITPILDAENNLQKLIVIDSDITPLKNAELKTQIQKEILEEQNKYITAGIEYAKTIQQASLPLKTVTDEFFESFVIYKPKDVVSGDFYWFSQIESTETAPEKTIIAVVDCTGHGVPGAFMSLIGTRLLSVIVNERKITSPGQILESLDKEVNLALMQAQTDNGDGMDVCICCIEPTLANRYKLTFAGAKRPLYYTDTTGNVQVIKGSRRRIGGKKTLQSNTPFSETTIEINSETTFYLTTDGFIDQNSAERIRFGTKRLINCLNEFASLPIEEQHEKLLASLANYQTTEDQRDDITLLAVRMKNKR